MSGTFNVTCVPIVKPCRRFEQKVWSQDFYRFSLNWRAAKIALPSQLLQIFRPNLTLTLWRIFCIQTNSFLPIVFYISTVLRLRYWCKKRDDSYYGQRVYYEEMRILFILSDLLRIGMSPNGDIQTEKPYTLTPIRCPMIIKMTISRLLGTKTRISSSC